MARVHDAIVRAELDRIEAAKQQALSETLAQFGSERHPGAIALGKALEARLFFDRRWTEIANELHAQAHKAVA